MHGAVYSEKRQAQAVYAFGRWKGNHFIQIASRGNLYAFSITFDVFVEAEVPSDCYMITASAFGEVSERVPAVKIYALETAVGRFSDVMWIMQQVVFMSMDKRLALFLVEDAGINENALITMTHEQIARHLGTAREVVSRMLKRFAGDGIVEVSRKGNKILDMKKLRNIHRKRMEKLLYCQ